MRIYKDCYELMSEIFRDVLEMGIKVHPHSMQNKVVKDDTNFATKEIIAYDYCLLSRDRVENLFLFDPTAKPWCKAEHQERVDPLFDNPGEAWKLRPDTWSQFLNSEGQFDYAYGSRLNRPEAIDLVVEELVANPDSRQAILSIWDRQIDIHNLGGKKRIPCSIYYQILVREGKVQIIYHQRSADVVTHFGNDIWLAWQMMEYFTMLLKARGLQVVSGYLYHNIGSLHVYNKDIPTLEACVKSLR